MASQATICNFVTNFANELLKLKLGILALMTLFHTFLVKASVTWNPNKSCPLPA